MDIKIRIDILRDTAQISDEVYQLLLEIVEKFNSKFGIELTEENGGMFITHLSAAITRINNNNSINAVDEETSNQIMGDSRYSKALEIFEEIKNVCKVEFPLGEEIFIITYICTILN